MSEPSGLSIIWEDAHLLVVNKPSGLLTQPRGPRVGEPSLEDAVRAHLAPDRPAEVYLGTVHRLDRPVSGAVVWAKNPKAARRLSQQFERRSVEKVYAAAVEGEPDLGAGEAEWVDHLGPVGPSGVAPTSSVETPGTKRAVTLASRIAEFRGPAGVSGLWLRPRTGRTHQLRAQTSARGCPIVGDAPYGARLGFPGGIALHARALTVHHPVLDRRTTFEAPWPVGWAEAGIVVG